MLLLFDIDGTLIHSAGAGRAAIERALLDVYGTAGPIDELPFDGLTDPQIVRALMRAAAMTDVDIDDRIGDLWAAYAAALPPELEARRDRLRVADGVAALLDRLDEGGACLGLVTGNIALGAEHKLAACGLWGRFAFGAYGSDAEDRDALPSIAVDRAHAHTGIRYAAEVTWVIGDTPRDVACARAAGVRCLAVGTGRFSARDLRASGADVALDSLAETDRVVSILSSGSDA